MHVWFGLDNLSHTAQCNPFTSPRLVGFTSHDIPDAHSLTVLLPPPWFDSYDAKRAEDGLGQSDMTVRVDHCAREPAELGSFRVFEGARRSYSLIALLPAEANRE